MHMPGPTCEELLIPIRLRRQKRNPHPFDSDDEVLYRWIHPDTEHRDDGRLSEAAIGEVFNPPIDISCNRSQFCNHKTDVLYNTKKLPHRTAYGVIQALVADVQGRQLTFNSSIPISILYEVQHTPEECMYPHTEILIFQDGKRLAEKVKPKLLRSAIRSDLAEVFRVCHEPDPNFTFPESYRRGFFARLFGWVGALFAKANRRPSEDKVERTIGHVGKTKK